MYATPHLIKHWRLPVMVTAVVVLSLMNITRSHADDNGFYGGRSLAGGAPAVVLDDKARLALEPGAVAMTADAAHLDGERIFGGYRFGSGFALEGAHTRFGIPGPPLAGETLSLAGVSSLPLGDSITLNAKLGLHRPEAGALASGPLSPDLTGTGVLYGLGLSLQLAQNVELRAQSERFARAPGNSQSGSADTFLFGANVRF
jgi:hypothetical protein